jgi:nucleoside phosphorylase
MNSHFNVVGNFGDDGTARIDLPAGVVIRTQIAGNHGRRGQAHITVHDDGVPGPQAPLPAHHGSRSAQQQTAAERDNIGGGSQHVEDDRREEERPAAAPPAPQQGPFWIHCAIQDEVEAIEPVLEDVFGPLEEGRIGDRKVLVGRTRGGRQVYVSCSGTNNAQGPRPTCEAWLDLQPSIKPSLAIMVGCMAGNPNRVQVGDLVVAELTFEYMAGSMDEGSVRSNAGTTVAHAKRSITDTAYSSKSKNWAALVKLPRPVRPNPIVHVAPVASGTSAVRNDWSETIWKSHEISWGIKKVYGLECEMHTFLTLANRNEVPCLCVKGVQDLADKDKAAATEAWRPYVIQASAAFAATFIQLWEGRS